MRFLEAVNESINLLEDYKYSITEDLNEGLRQPDQVEDDAHLIDTVIDALKAEPTNLHPTINGPADVDLLLRNKMAYQPVEHFAVVLLNAKNRVISAPIVAIGGVRSCLVDPKSLWKPALTQGACNIILVHNHPSGDTTPSGSDLDVTRKISQAGRLLGIELLDHLIVGADDFASLKDQHGCLFS